MHNKKTLEIQGFFGADDRDRTDDLVLTKDALYRLSYISNYLHIIANNPPLVKGCGRLFEISSQISFLQEFLRLSGYFSSAS